MRRKRVSSTISQLVIVALMVQFFAFLPFIVIDQEAFAEGREIDAGQDEPAPFSMKKKPSEITAQGYTAVPADSAAASAPSRNDLPVVALNSTPAVHFSDYAWEKIDSNLESPTYRIRHAMSFAGNGKVVMFGGEDSLARLTNETWIWDGEYQSWAELNPATKPSARKEAAMAYDEINGKVVMFGGRTGSGVSAETWLWNGSNWSQVTTSAATPPARAGAQMAFDGHQIVLFGGYKLSGSDQVGLDDTWLWDGQDWQSVSYDIPDENDPTVTGATYEHPPATYWGGMAYDGANAVMYGGNLGPITKRYQGENYNKQPYDHTYTHFDSAHLLWVWDGEDKLWSSQPGIADEAYGGRWGNAMAYDGRRVVSYSGEFDWVNPTTGLLFTSVRRPMNYAFLDYNIGKPNLAFGWKNGAWEPMWNATGNPCCMLEYPDWPVSRSFAAMAFDGTNFVLFGGIGGGHVLEMDSRTRTFAETWTFGYVVPAPPSIRLDSVQAEGYLERKDLASVTTNVYATGGREITERGIEYREYRAPGDDPDNPVEPLPWKRLKYDPDVDEGDIPVGSGVLVTNMENLEWQVTYEIRAYAVNEIGTSYTDPVQFTHYLDENVLPPDVVYERVSPTNLHVKDAKRIVVVGEGVSNLLRRPASGIDYKIVGKDSTAYPVKYKVRNDRELELTWEADLQPGKYDLQLHHAYFEHQSYFADALNITELNFYKPRDFNEIVVESTGEEAEVERIVLRGPFTESPDAPNLFKLNDTSEIVTLNQYVMFQGTSLEVDKRGSEHVIRGNGRLYVNGGGTMGSNLTYTLFIGPFTIYSDDLTFELQGGVQSYDYLGMNMPVDVKAITFITGGVRLTGDIKVEFETGTGTFKGKSEIDALQFRRDRFDFAGKFTVGGDFESGPIGGGELRFLMDTRVPIWGGGAEAQLRRMNIGFEIDFLIKRNKLDALSFGIHRKIKLGDTGAQITRLGGGFKNLSDQSEAPFIIHAFGGLSDHLSQELRGYNMINGLNLNVDMSKYHMEASGELYVYWVPVTKLEMLLLWNSSGFKGLKGNGFRVKAAINVFDVVIGNILAQYFTDTGFAGYLHARVQVPRNIRWVGGKVLTSIDLGANQDRIFGQGSIIGFGVAGKYTFKSNSFDFSLGANNDWKRELEKYRKSLGFANASPKMARTVSVAAAPAEDYTLKLEASTLQPRDIKVNTRESGKMDSGRFTAVVRSASPDVTFVNGGLQYAFEIEPSYEALLALSGDHRTAELRTPGNALYRLIEADNPARNEVRNVFYDENADTTYIRLNTAARGTWKLTAAESLDFKLYEFSFLNAALELDELSAALEQATSSTVTSVRIEQRGSAVFEIDDLIGDVTLYKPDGRPYTLQYNDTLPDWNAYVDSATGKLYLLVDAAETGRWLVDGGGSAAVQVYRAGGQDTMADVRSSVANRSYATQAFWSSLQTVVELEKASEHAVLYRPDGSPYPLQTDSGQAGWNAYYDEDARKWTLLVDATAQEAGKAWTVRDSGFVDVRVFAANKPFSDLGSILSESPGEYGTSLQINKPGKYLFTLSGQFADVYTGNDAVLPGGTVGKPVITGPAGDVEVIFDETNPNHNALLQLASDSSLPGDWPGDVTVTSNLPLAGNLDTIAITVDVKQPGVWKIVSAKQFEWDLYEVPPVPEISLFTAEPGAGSNQFEVKWNIDHPNPGTKVKIMLTNSAEQPTGVVLAENLPVAGFRSLTLPKGYVPGEYWLGIAAESEDYAPLFKVTSEPIEVTAPYMLPTPDGLELLSTGNGEVTLRFNSVQDSELQYYSFAMTELDDAGEAAATSNFQVDPKDGDKQQVIISGFEAGRSYRIQVMAVGTKDEDVVVSRNSESLELYLPEPVRPELSMQLDAGTAQSVESKYTAYYNEEETLIVTAAKTASLQVGSDQDARLELYVNNELKGSQSVAAGATAAFDLNALLGMSELEERDYDLTVEAVNELGDRSAAYRKLFVKRTAPHLYAAGEFDDADSDSPARKPLNGQVVYGNRVFITGTTDIGSTLTMNDIRVPLDASGSFNYYVPIEWDAEQRYQVTVVSSDQVGNKNEYGFEVVRGTGDPTLEEEPADLAALALDAGTLSTLFQPQTVTYSTVLEKETVKVYAVPAAADSTVTVNGETLDVSQGYVELTVPASGVTPLQVKVTAADDSSKTYTIQATGHLSDIAALSGLTLEADGTKLLTEPAFALGKQEYAAYVPYGVGQLELKATAYKTGSTLLLNGQSLINGQKVTVPLQVGDNTLGIDITSPDGTATETYTVKVTREMDTNANLRQLSLDGGAFTTPFDQEITKYDVVVPAETASIGIQAVADSSEAQIRVAGVGVASGNSRQVTLQTGLQTIDVSVTAQDGSEKTYTITALRQAPQAAAAPLLDKLELSGITLEQLFSPYRMSYTAQYVTFRPGVNVLTEVNTPSAVVTVNDRPVSAGGSASVPLVSGDNLIVAKVVSDDQKSSRTYSVLVQYRSRSGEDDKTRYAPVQVGGSAGESVAVVRSVKQGGTKSDVVNVSSSKAQDIVRKAKANGQSSARIVIDDLPDDPADEIEVQLSASALTEFAEGNLTLIVQTPEAEFILDQATLQKMQASGIDLYFRFVPIRDSAEQQQMKADMLQDEIVVNEIDAGSQVQVVSIPKKIETNYSGYPTKLFFPLAGTTLQAAEELAVYIEHSDGEKVLRRGQLRYDEEGRIAGIEIEVDKFSVFTVVRLTKEQTIAPYIAGYPDGTFRPDQAITRAELASILAKESIRTKGASAVKANFPDVPAGHWAAEAIGLLQAERIMEGDDQGLFRPDSLVTRAEMAVIATRWNNPVARGGSSSFTDTSGHWAEAVIARAEAAGIIQGYPDRTFRPDGTLLRAEAVRVLNVMFDRPVPQEVAVSRWPDVPASHWAIREIESASSSLVLQPDGSVSLTK